MTNRIGCGLWRKLNRTMTWSIIYVRSTLKTKLSFCDWSDQVLFVIKTSQDNNVTDRIGLVYTKSETEISGPIE